MLNVYGWYAHRKSGQRATDADVATLQMTAHCGHCRSIGPHLFRCGHAFPQLPNVQRTTVRSLHTHIRNLFMPKNQKPIEIHMRISIDVLHVTRAKSNHSRHKCISIPHIFYSFVPIDPPKGVLYSIPILIIESP